MNIAQFAHASTTHLVDGSVSNHDETNSVLVFIAVSLVAAILLYVVAWRLTGTQPPKSTSKPITSEEKAK